MASFPDSVKTFTTKNTGDTVQAVTVNDLQDEVNAIEAGYRNATAPLASSNSTVNNLSVAAASTLTGAVTLGAGIASTASFASSVTFSSGVTFSTTVTFGVRPTLPPPDATRLELAAAVQLADGSTVGMSWTNQIFLTNSSMHSTATNPDRVIPQSTGIYQVDAQVGFQTATSSRYQIVIEDSSASRIGREIRGSSGLTVTRASGIKRFDVLGGYVRVVVRVDGSTNSVDNGDTYLSVVKL